MWATPNAADSKGFPDLILVRERLIAVEVKGDGDTLRPQQKMWLERLSAAGVETYVWTRREWRDGTVDATLA